MLSTPRKTPKKGGSSTPVRVPRKHSSMTPRKDATQHSKGEEGIQVVIRMRPLNKNENNNQRIWKVLPKYSSVTQTTPDGKPLPERITGRTFFTFDKTFGEDTSTQQVYESTAKGIVSSVVTGLNGTIFAYGQTSSGKTFTMQGSGTIAEGSSSAAGGGIVHMAARDIFDHIKTTQDRIFLVRASFLEIYNEEVRDLLSDDNKTLQIREDPRRGVFVHSKEEIVPDFAGLLTILFQGEKSRAFASTAMNERSSRSHTIFRVTIESRKKPSENVDENSENASDDDGAVLISTLHLVDLAGSESVRHTGATGDRQKEGGMINTSLLTLSRVIVALGTPNQTHINFRDSKLTRILQPALSGNARMAVICCATPSELYLEETRSTLQFASRAKLVKTRAQVNEVVDDRSMIRRLQRELVEARRLQGKGGIGTKQVQELEEKVVSAGHAAKEAEDRLRRLQASILNGGTLFGDTLATETRPTGTFKKVGKRRLSDGYLILRSSSDEPVSLPSPKTLPRPTKRSKATVAGPLSPSTELVLVRTAMSSKNATIESAKRTAADAARQLKSKESEIIAANCSNDILRSERDLLKENQCELSQSIADFKSEMEEVRALHLTALAEKDSAISDLRAKLEQELADRRALEETVDTVQDQKVMVEEQIEEERRLHQEVKDELASKVSELSSTVEALQTEVARLTETNGALTKERDDVIDSRKLLKGQFDVVQDERIRSAFDLAQLHADKDELVAARQASDDKAENLAQQLETLETKLNECEEEKRSLEEGTSQLQAAVETTTSSLNETEEANRGLLSKLAAAESQIESISSERNETSRTLSDTEDQLRALEVSLTDTVVQRDAAEERFRTVTSELRVTKQQELALQVALERALSERSRAESEIEALLVRNIDTETDLGDLKRSQKILEDEHMNLSVVVALTQSSKTSLEANLGEVNAALEKALVEHRNVSELLVTAEEVAAEAKSNFDELQSTHEHVVQVGAEEKEAFIAEIEKLREANRLSEKNATDLKSRFDATETELSRVSTECNSKTEELELLRASLASSENSMNAMKEQLDEVREKLLQSETSLGVAVKDKELALQRESDVRGDLEEIQGEVRVLRTDLEAVQIELESANFEKCEARNAVDIAEKAAKVATTDLELLSQRVKSLEETKENVEANLQTTISEKSSLVDRTSELEQQLLEAEKATKVATTHLELLTQRVKSLEEAKENAEANLQATMSEKTSLVERTSELEQQLLEAEQRAFALSEQTTSDLSDAESEAEQLRAHVSSLSETCKTSESALANLKTELEALQRTKEATTAELESARDELQVLRRELADASDTEKKSQNSMDLLQQRLEQVEQDYDETCTALDVANSQVIESRAKIEESSKALAVMKSDHAKALSDLDKAIEASNSADAKNLQLQSQLEKVKFDLESARSLSESLAKRAEESIPIAELESFRVRVEELSSEVQYLNESKRTISHQLEATVEQKDTFAAKVHALEERLAESNRRAAQELQRVEADAGVMKSELQQCLEKNEYLVQKQTELETTNSELDKELKSGRDELIELHDMLEKMQSRLTDSNKRSRDFEEELESKNGMLTQCQATLDIETARLQKEVDSEREIRTELEHKIKALDAEKAAKENLLELNSSSTSDLQEEIVELKKLLISANAAVNEAQRAEAEARFEVECSEEKLAEAVDRLSRQEEERSASSRLGDGKEQELQRELERALGEKRLLQSTLDSNEGQYQKMLDELKERMGEEQRFLLKQGEGEMNKLKSQVIELRDELERSQAEGYTAREQIDDLRDGCKRLARETDQAKDKVAKLNRDNQKLRADLIKYTSELSTSQNKLDSALADKSAASRIARDLEIQKRELESEVGSLRSALAAQQSDKVSENADAEKELKLKELTWQLQAKNQRIAKLEKVKKTKQHMEEFERLKKENAVMEDKLSTATKESDSLRKRLSAVSESAHNTEVSQLHFDKQALETKLQKLASQCQRLSSEMSGMLQVLHASRLDFGASDPSDLPAAIVKLCDKVTSLEKERDSLSKTDERDSATARKLRELQEHIERLQKTVVNSRAEMEKLTQSEASLKQTLSRLRQEHEERREATSALEKERGHVRYLEQENLRLMMDIKEKKKLNQQLKSELIMRRIQGSDDTVDLGGGTTRVSDQKYKDSVPVDKENAVNSGAPLRTSETRTRQPLSIRKQSKSVPRVGDVTGKDHQRVPGLDISVQDNEESTHECNQS